MPITEKQLEKRQTHLGSSDMAAIMGVNPWASAYDVWAEKTGIVEPLEENEAMRLGNILEPAIINYAREELGPLTANQYRSLPDCHMGANVDAIVNDSGNPVEIKTAGLTGPIYGDWGDPGTDHVPEHYIVQCHVHMICTGKSLCHLAAFLGGKGIVMYTIPLIDVMATEMAKRANEFWESFVIPNVPPHEEFCKKGPSLEILKRVRRTPKQVETIHSLLHTKYQFACEAVKDATAKKEKAQAELIAAMGTSEAGDFGDAKKYYTYLEQSRTTMDVERFKAKHPGLFNEYSKTSTHRSLRLKNK